MNRLNTINLLISIILVLPGVIIFSGEGKRLEMV